MGTVRETAEQLANQFIEAVHPTMRRQFADAIDEALRERDERAAKIVDERAAFNRRLARTHKLGDPIADLKFTRADEAEVIAKEIREDSTEENDARE